jgi:hypothetical protein
LQQQAAHLLQLPEGTDPDTVPELLQELETMLQTQEANTARKEHVRRWGASYTYTFPLHIPLLLKLGLTEMPALLKITVLAVCMQLDGVQCVYEGDWHHWFHDFLSACLWTRLLQAPLGKFLF